MQHTKVKPSDSGTEPFTIGLSTDAAARAVGVSRRFLFLEMAAGRLASKRVGRRRLIPVASLQSWLSAMPDA